MSNKKFCPIMTIGFDPPEEGKRDNRICKKDCAWYNAIEENCTVNVIADYLMKLETQMSDISDYTADITLGMTGGYYDEPFGYDEKEEYYNNRYSKKT